MSPTFLLGSKKHSYKMLYNLYIVVICYYDIKLTHTNPNDRVLVLNPSRFAEILGPCSLRAVGLVGRMLASIAGSGSDASLGFWREICWLLTHITIQIWSSKHYQTIKFIGILVLPFFLPSSEVTWNHPKNGGGPSFTCFTCFTHSHLARLWFEDVKHWGCSKSINSSLRVWKKTRSCSSS